MCLLTLDLYSYLFTHFVQPLGHEHIYAFMDPSDIATVVGRRKARAESLCFLKLGLANVKQRLIVP